ncbi:hypothetical protein E4U57_002443 [Claviceps arundinis]|uniref:Uncharacterized protein n=1 Tax=Claviceps arundinis TaxID=1623583 RepID=A0ABQ7PNF3_9HYPO|nr:hypothetical protein E4U57_002443 [Claviceps arundinis]
MVFYGNAPVATPPPGASPGPLMVTPDGTRAETGSATRREIWRRTLDISFTQLPTLSEFADSLPRLATWAGVNNVNSGSSSRYTWRSASVYVLYANSKGGVAIRAETGPVSNKNVLRMLRVPKAGEGEGDATRQQDGDFTTQEEWDAEMGRWEGGQVELHAVVCMEGGEDA